MNWVIFGGWIMNFLVNVVEWCCKKYFLMVLWIRVCFIVCWIFIGLGGGILGGFWFLFKIIFFGGCINELFLLFVLVLVGFFEKILYLFGVLSVRFFWIFIKVCVICLYFWWFFFSLIKSLFLWNLRVVIIFFFVGEGGFLMILVLVLLLLDFFGEFKIGDKFVMWLLVIKFLRLILIVCKRRISECSRYDKNIVCI